MIMAELEQLLDMGFDKGRAELAVRRSDDLHGALQWLEKNENKSLEQIKATEVAREAEQREEDEETANNNFGVDTGEARSLICNECGKRFRNADLASYHAAKTDHTDFSESVEEIAPLTEEEKRVRLAELRQRVHAKKEANSVQEKEDRKQNERIRQKATKDGQDTKEEIQRKEQFKEASRKRLEKNEDIEARQRIKARIEEDKAERRRKAEELRASRQGKAPEASALPLQQLAAAVRAPRPVRTEAKLRLQTPAGNLTKVLPAETTLLELAEMVQNETGVTAYSFSTTFPKRTFEGHAELSKTLREAGLIPSAVLVVK